MTRTCGRCGAQIALEEVRASDRDTPEVLRGPKIFRGECGECGCVHERIRFPGRALDSRGGEGED